MAKVMYVGTCSVGPKNQVFHRNDIKVANTEITRVYEITPTQTEIPFPHRFLFIPTITVDEDKKLFKPEVDDVADKITFEPYGLSRVPERDNPIVKVKYVPYYGFSDLTYLLATKDQDCFYYRMGGTYATLEVGGIKLEAPFAGDRYNLVKVSWNSTAKRLTLIDGDRTWVFTGSSEDIINRLEALTLSDGYTSPPLKVLSFDTSEPSFPLTSFSGGTDGTVADINIQSFVDLVDIPADVTHIVILKELTIAEMALLEDFSIDNPTAIQFICPVLKPADTTLSAWLSTRPDLDYNFISLAYGTVTEATSSIDRLFAEVLGEANVSEIASNLNPSLTSFALPGHKPSELLDILQLEALKAKGITGCTSKIGSQCSVHEQVVTSLYPMIYVRVLIDAGTIAYIHMHSLLGAIVDKEGKIAEARKAIQEKLASISYLEISGIDIFTSENLDEVSLVLTVRYYSEIKSITFIVGAI